MSSAEQQHTFEQKRMSQSSNPPAANPQAAPNPAYAATPPTSPYTYSAYPQFPPKTEEEQQKRPLHKRVIRFLKYGPID